MGHLRKYLMVVVFPLVANSQSCNEIVTFDLEQSDIATGSKGEKHLTKKWTVRNGFATGEWKILQKFKAFFDGFKCTVRSIQIILWIGDIILILIIKIGSKSLIPSGSGDR